MRMDGYCYVNIVGCQANVNTQEIRIFLEHHTAAGAEDSYQKVGGLIAQLPTAESSA